MEVGCVENVLEFTITDLHSGIGGLPIVAICIRLFIGSLNAYVTWQPTNAGRRQSWALNSGHGRFLPRNWLGSKPCTRPASAYLHGQSDIWQAK